MKIKSIKNVLMVMLLTVLAFLYVGTTKTNAQITDEKDIPKGYTPVYTIEDLYGINNNLKGKYILMADIDMSATQEGGDWDFGNGWEPINDFTGILDGNGHRICNLHIFGDVSYDYVGLFGRIFNGEVINLGVENVDINITQPALCGGIAGVNRGDSSWAGDGEETNFDEGIVNCYVTGNIINSADHSPYFWPAGDYIRLKSCAGGIVGLNIGRIANCYSSASVSAMNAGGLFGCLDAWTYSCYSLCNVEGEKSSPVYASREWGDAVNFYYLKDLGEQKGKGIKALTKAQLKLQNCFTGFDFEKKWFIDKNSSYPYPQLVSCPQVRIESVKISSKPNKTSYGVKDDLDLTGATLVVNYEDNYSVEIPVEKSMCSYKMAKGVQTVTVDYFGSKASFDIEVGMEKEVLTVTSQTSNMVVGESFGFTADYNGSESIQFSSSNPKVLSINKKTGDAKAIKVGTAVVTITAGSLTKEIEVTVSKTADEGKTGKDTKENKKPETITEDTVEPDFEMEIGESFKLAIKKIKSRNLASSDATVVTINEKGKVVAVAPGVATITATDKKTNKVAESYVILVVGEEEPDFEIEVNESVRIAMKKGYTAESSNEKYVTVSKKGIIFGVKAGTATITVYDKMGKEVDKYIVHVTK